MLLDWTIVPSFFNSNNADGLILSVLGLSPWEGESRERKAMQLRVRSSWLRLGAALVLTKLLLRFVRCNPRLHDTFTRHPRALCVLF